MVDRVKDVASQSFVDDAHAFSKWFLTLYYNLQPNHPISISDGSGDGRVDAFFRKVDDQGVTHILVNSKFTKTFDLIAPPKFYDEIVRFWKAFDDIGSRPAYLETVRPALKAQFKVFFEQFDEGKAELVFVTNHRVNSRQLDTIKNVGVTILHLDEIIQYMIENIEGAMPRTNDLVLTDIIQLLSPPRAETSFATSIVFAKLVDFIEYMKKDPHALLFARNVRLDLGRTEVNKEIAETFARHPEEFAYSNNGITMLCEKHTHAAGTAKLTIVNPRVVNGAQTLHSVSSVPKQQSAARVMVKIIEVSPPREAHFKEDIAKRKEVINKIALRTNRQNTIQKSDLVANDEKQHEIAAFFLKNGLYYERRKREWNRRKIELQSVGIDKGPTLRYLTQLGASYFWETIGPAKARSGVKSLFDEDIYQKITSLSPETFYRLTLLQSFLLQAASRVASKTSARNRELRKYMNFAMFSLCVKVLTRIKIDIDKSTEVSFLAKNENAAWDALVRELFKMIDGHFRRTSSQQRSNGALTIINYSKNATFMSSLLREKIPPVVISRAKALSR
jgi:hypothetical protein